MNDKKYGLTFPQKNIWLVDKFNTSTSINVITGLIDIKGVLDEDICKEAINNVIKNNDAMRITLIDEEAEPLQKINEYEYYEVETVDMSLYSKEEVKEYINDFALQPIFLDSKELYDFKILKYNDHNGCILMRIHHIISDAWSCSQITTQIINYMETINDNQELIDEEKPSYLDFIKSQEEYETSKRYIKDKEFWEEYLDGIKSTVSLKNGTPKKALQADRYSIDIDKEMNESIIKFCKEAMVSPYALFLSAISTYIYRINDVDDIVLGTPILNRSNFKEKQMMGMFVSTIPMRIRVEEDIKFIDLAKNISKETMGLFRHQKYPYSKTLEYIRKNTDIKTNLYNILVSYQNARANLNDDKKYSTDWAFSKTLEDELQIHIMDMDDTGVLKINYDYLIDVFSNTEIEYLHTRIMGIISNAIEDSSITVENIRIMSIEEQNKILDDFNNTKSEYPKHKTIIEIFQEQVKKSPNSLAMVFEDKSITYQELNEKANKLAGKLERIYHGNGKLSKNIGVLISNKMENIEMIIAILKIGGTFVPIDINYPMERKEHIIKLANIDICLCDNNDILESNLEVTYIDNSVTEEKINHVYHTKSSDNLYIIFTSGSTGIPKGATISNQNFVNLLYSQAERGLSFTNKRVLQFATMCFDVSYQEIFSTLCSGSTLILIDDLDKKDAMKLSEYICNNNVDTLFIPPAYLRLLCEIKSNIDKLQKTVLDIIVAGEQLIITNGIEELLVTSNIKIHNHYGPAETHVVTTIILDKDSIKHFNRIPIGKPINNTKVLIIDKKERLLPIGINGEICVIGDCVGNGYINNLKMTEKSFKKSLYYNGQTMYKTGDMGLYTDEGIMFFNGRRDFQVKINGFRVEIEEIEKALSKLAYIVNAVLQVKTNQENKSSLVAILEFNKMVSLEELKKDISVILPKYMIPHVFYQIDKIPLNTNGKVDRKKIDIKKLQPVEKISSGKSTISIEELKEDHTNKFIIDCLEKIMNIKIISDFNFFDSGMDSLQAIKFQTELIKHGIVSSIQDIYDYDTLYKFIKFISAGTDKQNENDDILQNTVNIVKCKEEKISKILVTGATGYLGIHVLKSILDKDKNIEVICLTRRYKKNDSALYRIRKNIEYYFGEEYIDRYMERIEVLESDLSYEKFGLNDEDYYKLKEEVDSVVNCAAMVSHYAKRQDYKNSNFNSIENLISFAEDTNIILNHISTIGVSGNGLVENDRCIKDNFTEDDLYIGQEFNENMYVSSKILGENMLYKKMDNIKVNIIRVGNLTNRSSDCKFQQNYSKNAFQNKIGELFILGCVPENILENEYDITPVDLCSENIVNILLSNNYNGVYHIFNDNVLKFKEIISIMERANNIKVETVSIEEFKERLLNISINKKVSTLFQDMLIQNSYKLKIENEITKSRGYSIFEKIEEEYYMNMFKQLWRNSNEERKTKK